MKSFLEMWKLIETAELGTNKPVPLSKITPELAKAAISSGNKDGGDPKDDKAASAGETKTAVGRLKPMQKEVIPNKALAFALGFLRDGNPDLTNMEAITSNDGYIMDGHHRWAAATLINPAEEVRVTEVGLPASSLVTALNIWTKAKGRSGNSGKGDVSQFASSIPGVIDQFLQNGTDQWPNLTPQEVKDALGKVPGANGNPEAGKQIMINNAKQLPSQIHPDAPTRVDMPEVKNQAEINDVVGRLMNGDIDWNKPLSQSTIAALGTTNVSAVAGASTNASGQTIAAPNTTQQNTGVQGQAVQQNVGNQTQQPASAVKKFPQQQPLQRQVASTQYEDPSLNEWLILSGVKKS